MFGNILLALRIIIFLLKEYKTLAGMVLLHKVTTAHGLAPVYDVMPPTPEDQAKTFLSMRQADDLEKQTAAKLAADLAALNKKWGVTNANPNPNGPVGEDQPGDRVPDQAGAGAGTPGGQSGGSRGVTPPGAGAFGRDSN
jgi:hypothetical protein